MRSVMLCLAICIGGTAMADELPMFPSALQPCCDFPVPYLSEETPAPTLYHGGKTSEMPQYWTERAVVINFLGYEISHQGIRLGNGGKRCTHFFQPENKQVEWQLVCKLRWPAAN